MLNAHVDDVVAFVVAVLGPAELGDFARDQHAIVRGYRVLDVGVRARAAGALEHGERVGAQVDHVVRDVQVQAVGGRHVEQPPVLHVRVDGRQQPPVVRHDGAGHSAAPVHRGQLLQRLERAHHGRPVARARVQSAAQRHQRARQRVQHAVNVPGAPLQHVPEAERGARGVRLQPVAHPVRQYRHVRLVVDPRERHAPPEPAAGSRPVHCDQREVRPVEAGRERGRRGCGRGPPVARRRPWTRRHRVLLVRLHGETGHHPRRRRRRRFRYRHDFAMKYTTIYRCRIPFVLSIGDYLIHVCANVFASPFTPFSVYYYCYSICFSARIPVIPLHIAFTLIIVPYSRF